MNKQLPYQLLKTVLRLSFKTIIFLIRFALTVFFSSDLDKRIKASRQWESEHDELTAHVTQRKFHH